MGNTESNVTTGIKKQTDASSVPIYKLLNLQGEGELVDLMREANRTKNMSFLDDKIRASIPEYLYGGGSGKWIHLNELVLQRNKERPKNKQIQIPKQPDGCCLLYPSYDSLEELQKDKKDPSKYRFVCWDIAKRGTVGENILHLCMLNSSSVHEDLARRIIRHFPKMINDIYICDEYYGENCLHMAIVNEDVSMVKFLLNHDIDYHQRFCGRFVSPEDQKTSRWDVLDQEQIEVPVHTNYEGYLYWGEYPLAFASCLEQEECYRLILSRGADPDLQDSNGNMVLHMLVIRRKRDAFNMAYELGASLHIKNRQNLTPLTLAAKLAFTDMFRNIFALEREICWSIGNVVCAAYPLDQLDTIDQKTGNINRDSALNLIVYGDKDEHLLLLNGILEDLLNAKWNAFVKFSFFRKLSAFSTYFLLTLVCFTTRPGPGGLAGFPVPPASFSPELGSGNASEVGQDGVPDYADWRTEDFLSVDGGGRVTVASPPGAASIEAGPSAAAFVASCEEPLQSQTGQWALQALLVCGALLYLAGAVREACRLGRNTFLENMATVPSRVLFLLSCCLLLLLAVLEVGCYKSAADYCAVLVMLTTPSYFLFFCRGFKMLGPFVVILYKMIVGDLLRFVTIYMVFVMGFSQAFYVIFLTYRCQPDGNGTFRSSPMDNPAESIMGIFIMSMNNFGDTYRAFSCTDHEFLAKALFVIFMLTVAILMVNMLIAMMGNTYQRISEKREECLRQEKDLEEMEQISRLRSSHEKEVAAKNSRKGKGAAAAP